MSAFDPAVRLAMRSDLAAVMAAMAELSRDLQDPFEITPDAMDAALFGPGSHSACMLVGDNVPPVGAALFSPFVSTVLGHVCVYVSDLWVAESARGQSLGRWLLAATAAEGARRWQSKALFLNVYSESENAMAFYRHIGFQISQTDNRASLKGAAFNALLQQEQEK
ncbi:MAG: GNAT family N-acetyltransferase [Roseobacter sp.]